ncbi:DgyrCDS7604 [Dimorphilus gyrociliatus]|uniref:DgyrCDS7604 n=1 Tax=Dimorphilus gyrociliatus TaxID=2664684 RepID=A0A7I8VRM0_9ANNE|nr:DgyrCDS7604 [Dimorphilus gyrociliatus]
MHIFIVLDKPAKLLRVNMLFVYFILLNIFNFCFCQRHLTIDTSVTEGKKVYVVGDVHGCLTELLNLLKKENLLKSDGLTMKQKSILFMAGDTVNRGPRSCEVLDFIERNERVFAVRGNHEDNVLESGSEDKYPWLKDCPQAKDIIEKFPYTYRVNQYNAVVVHAGLMPDTEIMDQEVFAMTRMRNIERLAGGILRPIEETNDGNNWIAYWKGPQHIYFGHTARRGLQTYDLATGLDTRCYKGGRLTAVKMPSSEDHFVSIKCKKYN